MITSDRFDTAGTGAVLVHWPLVQTCPAWLQIVLQQVPLTQNPDWHCGPVVQLPPFGIFGVTVGVAVGETDGVAVAVGVSVGVLLGVAVDV